jgi:RNA polymerase sigma-70 factor (ECF subfamily)
MSYEEFETKIEGAVKKAKSYILSNFQINEGDLQDVLQETSLKAFKNLPAFRGGCSFETWFISICKNEMNALFRANKKRQFPNDVVLEISPEVYRKSEMEDRIYAVHEALSKLGEKHRQILELTLKNLPAKDAAELLKIPISSARTRLFYAKKQLKKILDRSYVHQSNI